MKKLLLSLALILLGGFGHYWLEEWVVTPKLELESDLNSRASPPDDQSKSISKMAAYLNQTSGKIVAAAPSPNSMNPGLQNVTEPTSPNMGKVQDLLRAIVMASGENDEQKARELGSQAISLFSELSENEVHERLTLLEGVGRFPIVSGQQDFKSFLVNLVEKYHSSSNPDMKTISVSAINVYTIVESDQKARDQFIEKYVNVQPEPVNYQQPEQGNSENAVTSE